MVGDKVTSGGKRKKGSSENEKGEVLRKTACEPAKGETLVEEEEPIEVGDDLEDGVEMEETGDDRHCNRTRGFKFGIDPDVLDCSICFNPLSPPIYQCRNGHIACSRCSPKLQNKCHFCSQPLGRRRCIALEKIIESITSPCKYANFGCRATLSFAEKSAHEKYCRYAALFCAISNCIFSGSKSLLFEHVKQSHSGISMNFLYNRSFMIALDKQQNFKVLLGEDGYVFVLLNTHENCRGNMLSVICMASSNPEYEEFLYELKVDAGESSLQLRTSAQKMRKWNGVHLLKAYLVVPDGLFASSPQLSITVCIYNSICVV